MLRKILKTKGFARILEAHNGISAIIVNDSDFDGVWESSFTDSASKGLPDADIVGLDSRCQVIEQIRNVTDKPIIFDGDTGGEATNFEYMVKKLERLGVSAVVIEDKMFPKRNSLDDKAIQLQEDPDVFATKIKRGKSSFKDKDFMIIARIESLISGRGMEDALKRADKYVRAGADGIMIHSRSKEPDEILEFAREYKKQGLNRYLVCVPTSYNTITEKELRKAGFNVVIYANHLLRASYKAMKDVANTILANGRSLEADPLCSSVNEIFEKVGFLEITEKDKLYQKRKQVIIPAAGKDKNFELPRALLEINGKTLLQRQVETIKKCGIENITVIRGYKKEKFVLEGVKYIDNEEYMKHSIIHSLFCAEEDMENGFICIYSDIIFNESIINQLIETEGDIVIVVDNSYEYHKPDAGKKIDLVITKKKPSKELRVLKSENEAVRIGTKINKELGNYEYIGICYFSEYGAKAMRKIYHECKKRKGKFHEARDFAHASDIDMLQELIDRGFKVKIMEIHKGWIEIHSKKDYEIAKKRL